MSYKSEFEQLSVDIRKRVEFANTEEAIKTSCVLPFFAQLGYDIFDPTEFCPEYTCDVGTKKGEKVDFAIMADGEPVILIECKHSGQDLDKHVNQLYRYFTATNASFAILTDGLTYQFYTDTIKANIMDLHPFLEFNLSSYQDYQLAQLLSFHKLYFNRSYIQSTVFGIQDIHKRMFSLQNEIERQSVAHLRVVNELKSAHLSEINNLQAQIQSLERALDKADEMLSKTDALLSEAEITLENYTKKTTYIIDNEVSNDIVESCIEYLNMPVPAGWEYMNFAERRQYWLGDKSQWCGKPRNYVCTPEVCREFFGLQDSEIGIKNRRKVAKVIRATNLFVQTGRKKSFPHVGCTLAWIRRTCVGEKEVKSCTKPLKTHDQESRMSGSEILKRVRALRNQRERKKA